MNKSIHTLTRSGEKTLKKELDELKAKREETAEKLKTARGFGDLSENSEYDEAKNEQGLMEARIIEIEAILANAQIIEDDEISTDKVGIGTSVRMLDVEMNEEMEFKIVSVKEADINDNKMSDESPIGKAINGHKVGEVVDVETPSGVIQFKILEIRKAEDHHE